MEPTEHMAPEHMAPPEQATTPHTAPVQGGMPPGYTPPPGHAAVEPERKLPVLGRRRRLRTVGAAMVAVLLVVAAVAAVKGLTGEDSGKSGELKSASGDSFRLSYPKGWEPLSGDELSALPGRPVAVLRREDGDGLVVVRKEKRAPRDFNTFATDLTSALQKRVPDFQKRSSRTIKVRAGNAFFYSYIRKRKGTVHTVVLLPAGDRSYAVNTISAGGAEDVARQIARIILSIDV